MANPIAGYSAKLYVGGTSTAVTGEACALVSGKTYRVTSSSKRVLDPAVARTWKDSGSAVAASNIESEDLLFGTVTFVSGYTPAGSITLDGNYLPRTAVAWATGASANLKRELIDVTDIGQTAGSGVRKRVPGMFDATFTLSRVQPVTDVLFGSTSFWTLLAAGTPVLVEHLLDATHSLRAWVIPDSAAQQLSPSDVVRGDTNFSLASQGTTSASAGIGYGSP